MLRETVYNGVDNAIDVILKKSGSAQDLSSVTRIKLLEENDAFELDSTTDTDVFTWTGLDYTGQVKMVLGLESIPDGTYTARLITIDPTYTNGLCWGEIELEVVTP